jgi:hypothetical protein
MLAALAADAQAPDALGAALRLVVRSGLSVQLRELAPQLAEQVRMNRGKVADATLDAIADAGKESFRAEVLQADMVQSLAMKLKVQEMEEVIAWLETDAGRRVTVAEESASGARPEALRNYAERQKSRPVSPRRSKLIKDLLAVTNSVQTVMATSESIALGVAVGIDGMQPAQKRIGLEQLRARLRAAMPPDKMKQELNQSLPALFAFVYRDVRDDTLSAYVRFLKSPLGKRYNDAAMEAFNEVMTRASVRMGQHVERTARKSPV